MVDAIAMPGLQNLLNEARAKLRQAGIADPALDCRLLAERATGLSAIELLTQPNCPVSEEMAAVFDNLIDRRAAGESVHRILGIREFYGLKLAMPEGTLEPRPDTECLVELVLPEARRFVEELGECRVLDLGTGTGAIALALLSEVPEATAVGVDIAEAPIAAACKNALDLGFDARFEAVLSNWYENVTGRFHIIVANPPYIVSEIIETLAADVRDHDPRIALDGGEDGLDAYRKIAGGARRFLCSNGVLAVETGYDQKRSVEALFAHEGFVRTGAATDLSGRDRALKFAS